MRPIGVLIVDDQALVRTGLRMILELEPDITIVGEAVDGAEAVNLASTSSPDVILMDVHMPRVSGLEATRRIVRGRDDAPRVLMVTTFDLDIYVYEALQAGASGFVLKDMSPERLVDAVRVVASGEALLSPKITRRLIEEFVRRPPEEARPKPPELEQLTVRETEIMALVSRGLSNAEIAARAYVTEATVKTHIARILMKLGLRDRVQVVVYAYEHGLTKPGEAEDIS